MRHPSKTYRQTLFFLICCLVALTAGCASRQAKVVFAPPGRTYFVVQTDTLNMRRCPERACQVLALLYKGETVAVRRTSGNWSEIETKQGGIGWVASGYLAAQHLGDRMDSNASAPAQPEEELASPHQALPPEISDELAQPGIKPKPATAPPEISEEFGK
ncbi:MAG: SH3 domain-containing protein [Desulfoprunum sp.]|nr:SH3 domain-containing protein [Desulfoprunum sp.]